MIDPIPHPVLLNAWKHHAGWLRWQIAIAVQAGQGGMAALAAGLAVVGTRLMDLYTGPLKPAGVARQVIGYLRDADRLGYEPLAAWLAARDGYAVLDLPDGSRWTVRLGPAGGRYVHLHPGRKAPHTSRVQANTLKSAVMALALAGWTGRDPLDVRVANEARGTYLGLLPIPEVTADRGLGAVIALLAPGGREA